MKSSTATLSKGFAIVSAIGALAAVFLVGAPAAAQWAPPPPEYIATTEPVYYEGTRPTGTEIAGSGATSTEHGATTTTSLHSSPTAGLTSHRSGGRGSTEAGADPPASGSLGRRDLRIARQTRTDEQAQPLERQVDDRRRVEGQQLRRQQAAYDGHSQRSP